LAGLRQPKRIWEKNFNRSTEKRRFTTNEATILGRPGKIGRRGKKKSALHGKV